MKKILVTGGAGYIGSQTILEMLRAGRYLPISIDNFSNSSNRSLEQIEMITGIKVYNINIDLANRNLVQSEKKRLVPVEAVIHFAAHKSVPMSIQDPIQYYRNNLDSLLNVLELCEQLSVRNFIFSSSCSVYGDVDTLPVSEIITKFNPLSPYAHTKLIGEEMIERVSDSQRVRALCLRYFNPVGADSTGLLGEDSPSPPNNLVPIICNAASGARNSMEIYGRDYATRDGTCIRDYVHVVDIAKAHLKAVDYLVNSSNPPSFDSINLGSGRGVSVLEAITAFERVTGKSVNYIFKPRRQGDVAQIFSNSKKAKAVLDWMPVSSIDEMMYSAWKWHNTLEILKTRADS